MKEPKNCNTTIIAVNKASPTSRFVSQLLLLLR